MTKSGFLLSPLLRVLFSHNQCWILAETLKSVLGHQEKYLKLLQTIIKKQNKTREQFAKRDIEAIKPKANAAFNNLMESNSDATATTANAPAIKA